MSPSWRRDGKELFYIGGDSELIAATLSIGSGSLDVLKIQKLFDGAVKNIGTVAVSADGQKFLMIDSGITSSPPLTLLQNWTGALRK